MFLSCRRLASTAATMALSALYLSAQPPPGSPAISSGDASVKAELEIAWQSAQECETTLSQAQTRLRHCETTLAGEGLTTLAGASSLQSCSNELEDAFHAINELEKQLFDERKAHILSLSQVGSPEFCP